MKEKMFSLFLVVTLFLTSFNPVFALGSEINGNDENSTKEDLPIVTEKVPEDSAKDKYVKILFVPETNLINNVQNYGTIKNENNEEVALRDEVYNGETAKAKAFYALKSAKWSDLINYRENGKKIFLKLWVENKDKKENWDNYYPDYYNYFPDLNKSDGERNTFKVFVSLPEKVKEEKKAYENTSYVFHINDFYYEIIRDGLSRKINMDIAPIINNGRTMLPLRKVAEVLGAKVIWNKDTRTAFFKRSGQTASIQIDNNKIILSSGEVIEMEAKPLNIQDRIFVSLFNVAKVFGLNNGNKDDGKDNDIEWDNEARTVTIYVK